MRFGLLKRSFIPEVEQRDLRDLTRYRTRLVDERTSASNRLQKILEDANIKLSSVATRRARRLGPGHARSADPAARPMRRRWPTWPRAGCAARFPSWRRRWRAGSGSITASCGANCCIIWMNLNAAIWPPSTRGFASYTAPYEAIIQRLDAIPGIDRWTAEVILAEIGPDVTPFRPRSTWPPGPVCVRATTSAPTSAAAARPAAARTGCGPALVEAAWAAARTKDRYFGSQFHRLRARRGDKRAAVAVAHSILIVVYHLLAKPEAVYHRVGWRLLPQT